LRELEGQKAPTEILLKQIKIQNTRYTKHRKEEERGKRESLRDKEKEKTTEARRLQQIQHPLFEDYRN
jgi:hypothetical protein